MKEDFLHFLWKNKYINTNKIATYHGSKLDIIKFGLLNTNAGPDFENAEIVINQQLWVGNVEMHLKSSDWDKHQHTKDKAYNNVILHVVWEHDKEINFLRERNIETLILKDFVLPETISLYKNLFFDNSNEKQIACYKSLKSTSFDQIFFWYERLIIERLENKNNNILTLHHKNNNHWEETAFKLIAENFGLVVNKEAFNIWSMSFPFKVLQKIQHNTTYVEALFFGQAGFLNEEKDEYQSKLKQEYLFLKNKYNLVPLEPSIFKFSRMRPIGFPTIKIAQLAAVYSYYKNIFSELINSQTINDMVAIFSKVKVNSYWDNHYQFGEESIDINKNISLEKINNLLINTIIPLKFTYYKSIGKLDPDIFLSLLESIPREKNNIITLYNTLNFPCKSAKDSQALIELNKNYCNKKKCLDCYLSKEIFKI